MQKSVLLVRKKEPEKITDKPKAAVDTNVLVSAFLSPKGKPAQILSLITEGALLLCHNQAIFDEYEDVLSRPGFVFEVTPEERRFVLDTLKTRGLSCNALISSDFPMKDESDRKFYDVAKAAEAFLVTGNKKHYPDEPFIVIPRDFINTFIYPLEAGNFFTKVKI